MEGWVKLFRQLKHWEWYSDTVVFRVFIHLLLSANYEDKRWKGLTIKRGQVFTSYQHIVDEIGDKKITLQRVRRAISCLKSTGEITVLSTHQGLLVTIEKYDLFQMPKEKTADLSTDFPTFNQQTSNTNIRNKRNKEERRLNFMTSFNEELENLYDN